MLKIITKNVAHLNSHINDFVGALNLPDEMVIIISRSIVQGVKSKKGKGTTLKVKLPNHSTVL